VWNFRVTDGICEDDYVYLEVRRPWSREWKVMPYLITEKGESGFVVNLHQEFIKVIGFSGTLWKLKVEIKRLQ
jgi:hypothetical protein